RLWNHKIRVPRSWTVVNGSRGNWFVLQLKGPVWRGDAVGGPFDPHHVTHVMARARWRGFNTHARRRGDLEEEESSVILPNQRSISVHCHRGRVAGYGKIPGCGSCPREILSVMDG